MKPKISVIVPVYKVEDTLERCIQSIRCQTLKDIEIILVDDGSPDKCPALCEQYAKDDERIIVVHKSNEGLGFARNSGIEIANGEYLAFVDSDDYIEIDMMNRLYSFASENMCDVVYGGYNLIRDKRKVGERILTKNNQVLTTKNEIIVLLMNLISSDITESEDAKYGATVWKGIFSNSIIKENNIRFYSEREYVSEDGLFDIDFISKCTRAGLLTGTYYNYEYNPKSLTSSYRPDRFEKNKKLFSLGTKKLREYYGDESLIKQYGRMFIAASRVCIMQEIWNCKKAGLKNTLQHIRHINKDEMLVEVLKQYPWKKLPLKKRLFCFMMAHNMAICEMLSVKITS